MPSPEKNRIASNTGAFSDDSFAPFAALQNALRFWWFLFLLMLAGGLVGWLIHQSRPPLYEAVGQFSASIDFVRTGPLTQLEEDIALNAVGRIVSSSRVVNKVVEQAGVEGIATNVKALRQQTVLERRVDTWQLRVRSSDPRRAERLANIWVDQGQAVLVESYRFALQAEDMQRVLQSLESCLEQSVAVEPASYSCNPDRFVDIQADMSAASKVYGEAKLGSLGLSPGLILGPVEHAVVSSHPVILARNQVVLAGCLLGLLAGILLLQFGIPSRWIKRS